MLTRIVKQETNAYTNFGGVGRGILRSYRPMWMGSHFPGWADYNGAELLIEWLEQRHILSTSASLEKKSPTLNNSELCQLVLEKGSQGRMHEHKVTKMGFVCGTYQGKLLPSFPSPLHRNDLFWKKVSRRTCRRMTRLNHMFMENNHSIFFHRTKLSMPIPSSPTPSKSQKFKFFRCKASLDIPMVCLS